MTGFLKFIGGVVLVYLIMSGIAMTGVIVIMKALLDWNFHPDWLMYLVGNFTPIQLHGRIVVIQMGLGVLFVIGKTIWDKTREENNVNHG